MAAQAVPARAAIDLKAMQPTEIEAVQKRLTDAGCYRGLLDGQPSAAIDAALNACPDQSPLLRIETGTHTARITRIATDVACSLLVTASDDKTVRLWSMPDGQLVRTIRLPIDTGSDETFAVAISPDSRMLVVGGFDAAQRHGLGYGIYVMDLAGGGVRRLGDFSNGIAKLAFSFDGSRVAVGFFGKGGMRVIDVRSGQTLMSDSDGYDDIVFGIAFARDGSILTSSWDGFLRRYGPDLKLKVKVSAWGGRKPHAIALDPMDKRLAVGFYDDANVSIVDAMTLVPLVKSEVNDVSHNSLAVLAWSADGRQIAASSAWTKFDRQAQPLSFVRLFTPDGAQVRADIPRVGYATTDMTTCGPGYLFADSGAKFGRIDLNGGVITLGESKGASMRDKTGMAFVVSSDASRIRFGLGVSGADPVIFDVPNGKLEQTPVIPSDMHPATITGLPVTDWIGYNPKLDGHPITLSHTESAHSLVVDSDLRGFVLGGDFTLRAFDQSGRQKWLVTAPGFTFGVNESSDGNIVVAAHGDGTIRWYQRWNGHELLALFVHAQSKRWVAWTPTGYYMASPGGEDLIGWQVNRGWEQEADFFPASRFRDKFNRPDVVQRVLTTLDEREALKQANEVSHRRLEEAEPIIEHLPPVITILSPVDGASAAPGTVEVRYRVRLPSGGVIERLEAFVDGAKVEMRGLAPPVGSAKDEGSIILPMPSRDALISLVAYAGGKASDAAQLLLKSARPAATTVSQSILKPNLYALLIGISHYDDARYDLAYATKDAADLAGALKTQESKLYRHVEVKIITDHDATAMGIKRGLTWLRRQTTAHDLAVIFAAGHGMTDAKGKFWFLPTDMDLEDVEATAVSQNDIENVLFDLPGKKLLFLDACHSGAALNAGARGTIDVSEAVSDFAQAEGGVVAYAASTGRELSFERDEWGHGAFTKALIEGFSGQADILHQGTVTTTTLDLFIEQRVKELTGGLQHPVMTRPKTVPDFPIAAVP